MSTINVISTSKCFGGDQLVISHDSTSLGCKMKFSIFLPPKSKDGKCPVLYFLSGLTCDEQVFINKGGAQKAAATYGIIIVGPDTSPRGCNIEGETDDWDFGVGAGFYLDATQEKWKKNYNMHTYVTQELPCFVNANFPAIPDRVAISGYSMGGHGALMLALRNPGMYRSVSAFAPICNPMNCPWGKKAFSGYLGPDIETWKEWDATELVAKYKGPPLMFLIDQGKEDQYYKEKQLLPENLTNACLANKFQCITRYQEGYDHSFYFVKTFIEEHIKHHSEILNS
ncbi:S-formylglutathione hydrolase [Oopsacas minuta]|uniref:S-formylglutathione hydrolase n=1 Tax=Oopsacas minuta TaxID=111878 RepID=A0AAV7JKB2_9METZ|nr:S-formylglutathione hydrolase [Oopsacas minuta]